MTRRVVFLDIDGVLAPIRRWDRYGDVEVGCMQVLNESGAPLALDVRTAAPFRVTFVPVITRANGRQGDVTLTNRGEYLETAMRVHPLVSNDANVHTPEFKAFIVNVEKLSVA